MVDEPSKIDRWQIKIGVIGLQLVAFTVLIAYIFSSPIDRDEKKRAKAPAINNAIAQTKLQKAALDKTQWHYPNSPTIDIPIREAMALVIRDAKAGPNASLVPAVGMHNSPTRPVGVVAAAKGLPKLEMGKWVWNNKGCRACHAIEPGAAKLPGPPWVGIFGTKEKMKGGAMIVVDEAYLIESIKNPMAKIVDGYAPAMPPLPLTKEELAGVVEFIKSLTKNQ